MLSVTIPTGGRADDPSFLSIGAGYYDLLHDADAAEFRVEYRSRYRWWLFKPFAGVTATTNPAGFAYAGVLSDFYFGNRVVVTPSIAAGPYLRGRGKDLGHVFEIRSGLEIAYRFNNRSRLGLLFYHISNAGLGCPSPLKLGHYFVPDRGDFDGSETTFRRGHSEAVA